MTNVLLKKNCGVGRKGDTVSVSDDYAQRLNESGIGKIVHKAKALNDETTASAESAETLNGAQPAAARSAKASGKKAVMQP